MREIYTSRADSCFTLIVKSVIAGAAGNFKVG